MSSRSSDRERDVAGSTNDLGPHGRSRVRVRGTRDGLVIELPDDVPALDLIQDLQDDIASAGRFFQRGALVIDYGTRTPDLEEISAFDVMLRERGIQLRTVTASSVEHRDTLQRWGFRQPRWKRAPGATGEQS